ncbi:MAG TPA: hypothetical protein VF490_01610 [Chryseosolibacter sp.]
MKWLNGRPLGAGCCSVNKKPENLAYLNKNGMETAKIDRTKKWTADDYATLGEMNTPCQLINGELIICPSSTPLHQRVLRTLFKLLDAHSGGGQVFFCPPRSFYRQKECFSAGLDIYLRGQQIVHIQVESKARQTLQ